MAKNKRGFTLIETIIVIAVIAIISVVFLPILSDGYDDTKKEIVDIYNGKQVQIIDVDTKEIIYQGEKEKANFYDYKLVDIEYGQYITMYIKKK